MANMELMQERLAERMDKHRVQMDAFDSNSSLEVLDGVDEDQEEAEGAEEEGEAEGEAAEA